MVVTQPRAGDRSPAVEPVSDVTTAMLLALFCMFFCGNVLFGTIAFIVARKFRSRIFVAKGVGRHRQGGAMPPPWPENSFILTIEATKNRG